MGNKTFNIGISESMSSKERARREAAIDALIVGKVDAATDALRLIPSDKRRGLLNIELTAEPTTPITTKLVTAKPAVG